MDIISVPAAGTVLDAIRALSDSGEICLPAMEGAAVLGFVHMMDIIGFLTDELKTRFKNQIDL